MIFNPKPKQIILPLSQNRRPRRQSSKPIRARNNVAVEKDGKTGFCFTRDWLKWRECFSANRIFCIALLHDVIGKNHLTSLSLPIRRNIAITGDAHARVLPCVKPSCCIKFNFYRFLICVSLLKQLLRF